MKGGAAEGRDAGAATRRRRAGNPHALLSPAAASLSFAQPAQARERRPRRGPSRPGWREQACAATAAAQCLAMPPNASAAAAGPGRVQTAPGKTAHAAAPAVVNIKLSPSASSSSTALVSFLRRRVRPHVHAAARGGVPLVRWVQRAFHGSTPWHALLRILVAANALAVSEEFYATALPAAMWMGRWRWASYALCAQALSLALGNALKDTFACPRPWQLAKDVVAIDQVGSCPVMDEYGFPSTHSWNGLCLGTSLALLAVAELGVGPLTAGMCAGAWVAFVAFGRLYVGAHTLVDIMGGLVMGMLTTAFVYAALGPLAALLMECEHPVLATTCTVCLCAALLDLAHTTPPMPTPSKKYARSLTATAAGVAVGFARVVSRRARTGKRVATDRAHAPIHPVLWCLALCCSSANVRTQLTRVRACPSLCAIAPCALRR